jgi:hypothetical protein
VIYIKIEENYINDMLIGSLLGDGSIEKNNSKRNYYTIGFTQCSYKERNYIQHKFNLLSRYYKLCNIKDAHNNTVRFRFSLTEKKIIKEMTKLTRYDDNSRKFPPIEYFTPVVLLYWYLDDGSLSIIKQKRPNGRKPSIHRKLRIALSSFRDEDILNITAQINKKFNLKFKPFYEKGKIVSIGISNSLEDISKFLELIYPYKDFIPKEMHYKFCLCYHDTQITKKPQFNAFNVCNFNETGICACRNKDLSEIFK